MSDENSRERPADAVAPVEHAVRVDHVAPVGEHVVAEVIAVEAVTDDAESAIAEVVEADGPIVEIAVAEAVEVVTDDTETADAEVVEVDGSIVEIVYEADSVLLAAVDQARAALAEITPARSIGEVIGHTVEGEHVLSLHFASTLSGYPDWHWAATLARTDENAEPTVLEVELLPGEGAILSPAWVPWADRVTPESLIDDSENEFADDDDDLGDDADDVGAGDDDSDDDSEDDDESDDDIEDDDESDVDDDLDAEEIAARALRRDRDGIDIDTIAEEGLDIDGLDAGELDHLRLIDDIDDAVELTEESLATEDDSDENPHGRRSTVRTDPRASASPVLRRSTY